MDKRGRTSFSSFSCSSPVRFSCPCCATSGLWRILPFSSSFSPSNLSPISCARARQPTVPRQGMGARTGPRL
jgi:hypothetical protein